MTFYPVEGSRYLVTEWDGTKHKVKVQAVTEDSVVFEYESDGLVHEVHPNYFVHELVPLPLPTPRSSGYYNIHL